MSGERNWLRQWWFVWLPLAVMALLAAAYGGYRAMLQHKVKEHLQAFADAGYPTTLEELDEWYEEPPPGQNAADIYLEAFRHLVEPTEEEEAKLPWVGDVEWPEPGQPLPPEMKSAIEAHLSANRETIRLLREAASREGCRYPIDLEEGITAKLPPLGKIRASARLLILTVWQQTREGKADAAAGTLEAAFRLANSLVEVPDTICQLVRRAAEDDALDGLDPDFPFTVEELQLELQRETIPPHEVCQTESWGVSGPRPPANALATE